MGAVRNSHARCLSVHLFSQFLERERAFAEREMIKIVRLQSLLQSISCFMCFSIASKNCDLVFMNYGGYVVGSLLDANEIACRLFFGAIILSFIFYRLAAIGGLAASFLFLPLNFYQVAPGTVQYLFPGPYWPRSRLYFVWDKWAFFSILLGTITLYVCCQNLLTARTNSERNT